MKLQDLLLCTLHLLHVLWLRELQIVGNLFSFIPSCSSLVENQAIVDIPKLNLSWQCMSQSSSEPTLTAREDAVCWLGRLWHSHLWSGKTRLNLSPELYRLRKSRHRGCKTGEQILNKWQKAEALFFPLNFRNSFVAWCLMFHDFV